MGYPEGRTREEWIRHLQNDPDEDTYSLGRPFTRAELLGLVFGAGALLALFGMAAVSSGSHLSASLHAILRCAMFGLGGASGFLLADRLARIDLPFAEAPALPRLAIYYRWIAVAVIICAVGGAMWVLLHS